jgi:hypothetical protein
MLALKGMVTTLSRIAKYSQKTADFSRYTKVERELGSRKDTSKILDLDRGLRRKYEGTMKTILGLCYVVYDSGIYLKIIPELPTSNCNRFGLNLANSPCLKKEKANY